jgi:hypothetical protein
MGNYKARYAKYNSLDKKQSQPETRQLKQEKKLLLQSEIAMPLCVKWSSCMYRAPLLSEKLLR